MALQVHKATVKKDYNWWARYRDPKHVDLSPEGVKKVYRVDDPAFYPAPRVPPNFNTVPVRPRAGFVPPPATFSDNAFLQTVPNVCMSLNGIAIFFDSVNIKYFAGIKLIASQQNSVVGLFKATNPKIAPPDQYIVIKQATTIRSDCTKEGFVMKKLSPNGDSRHVVNLINTGAQPHIHNEKDLKESKFPDEWLGKCRRLYMECCPHGSLWNLLNAFIDA